jgi:hypothetical protein
VPRQRGLKKTGGRRAGTPNRRSVMLHELLQSLDCDVPKRLVALLPELSPERQADVLLELMQYLYPKRKAIELTGAGGEAIAIEETRQIFLQVMANPETRKAAEVVAEGLVCGK